MAQHTYARGAARRTRSPAHERHVSRGEPLVEPERAPVLQVERPVHPRTVNGDGWFDYITDLSGANLHLDVKQLGNMACVYIDTERINILLADRYPRSYGTRKGIVDIQKGFVADFRVFVRNSLAARRENEVVTTYQERVGQVATYPQVVAPHNPLADMWGTATVRVRPNLAIAGSNALALDLSANPVLWEEAHEIYTYLEHDENLKLGLIHSKDDRGPCPPPHVRIVEVEQDHNVADLAIRLPDAMGIPGELTLGAPRAWRESATVRVRDVPEIISLDEVVYPPDALV